METYYERRLFHVWYFQGFLFDEGKAHEQYLYKVPFFILLKSLFRRLEEVCFSYPHCEQTIAIQDSPYV